VKCSRLRPPKVKISIFVFHFDTDAPSGKENVFAIVAAEKGFMVEQLK
jgi:hypothetical protein